MMMMEDQRERLLEAAVALLQEAPDHQLNIVILNKALFYLDLVMLRDRGETFTHNPYVALPQGPVIAKYEKRLIAALVAEELAEQVEDGASKPVRLLGTISSPRFLDPGCAKDAKKIVAFLIRNGSKGASTFSHDNPGWAMAWRAGLGQGKAAQPINMNIAMQQIMGDDPWLDEPADDALLEQIRQVEQGERVPW